ncbi:F-box/kelch-repeat protein At3g23880-like [Lotus japonicus]|uniref:F-box/kelch-repeat protein At3g23880-like n=1 Tax=Lotus japonicus TaxID=34305 RepID=UPI00258B735C|nr:F-box/kelch-repeat protein At3g23880-like [Lotus japonicus]
MAEKYNHIVGSINGLLCLRDINNGCFTLYNPSTKLVSRKSLAFPKEISRHWIPNNAFFGYDKVNDKYKVLALGVDGAFKLSARLYTFGESESNWRTMTQDLSFGARSSWDSRQTFLNGNLHWLPRLGPGHGSDKLVIISFDVEKETHGEMLLPSELEGEIWSLDLHVFNKYLYVSQYSHKTRLVLWLMKEYGVQESWTKVMTIPLKSRYRICRCDAPRLIPLSILGNGVVVLRTGCYCSYLVTYDSKNDQFGRRCRIKRSSPLQWHVGIYHESLVSPP